MVITGNSWSLQCDFTNVFYFDLFNNTVRLWWCYFTGRKTFLCSGKLSDWLRGAHLVKFNSSSNCRNCGPPQQVLEENYVVFPPIPVQPKNFPLKLGQWSLVSDCEADLNQNWCLLLTFKWCCAVWSGLVWQLKVEVGLRVTWRFWSLSQLVLGSSGITLIGSL